MRPFSPSSIGDDHSAEMSKIREIAERLRKEQSHTQEYGFSSAMLSNLIPAKLDSETGYNDVVATLKGLPNMLREEYQKSTTVNLLIDLIKALKDDLTSKPGYRAPPSPQFGSKPAMDEEYEPYESESNSENDYVELLPDEVVNEEAKMSAHDSYLRAEKAARKENKKIQGRRLERTVHTMHTEANAQKHPYPKIDTDLFSDASNQPQSPMTLNRDPEPLNLSDKELELFEPKQQPAWVRTPRNGVTASPPNPLAEQSPTIKAQ